MFKRSPRKRKEKKRGKRRAFTCVGRSSYTLAWNQQRGGKREKRDMEKCAFSLLSLRLSADVEGRQKKDVWEHPLKSRDGECS